MLGELGSGLVSFEAQVWCCTELELLDPSIMSSARRGIVGRVEILGIGCIVLAMYTEKMSSIQFKLAHRHYSSRIRCLVSFR